MEVYQLINESGIQFMCFLALNAAFVIWMRSECRSDWRLAYAERTEMKMRYDEKIEELHMEIDQAYDKIEQLSGKIVQLEQIRGAQ